MYLDTLSIAHYKNISEEELNFSPSLNCFVGANGSGKTNVLDAIHYLSLTKSALRTSDTGCIEHGEQFFILKGKYSSHSDEKSHTISATFQRGKGKKFMHSTKEYERLGDHIGRFPLVIVTPADVELISDGAEYRRRFINTLFSQIDAEYLSLMVKYNGVLAQRNSLLKNHFGQDEVLEIVSLQLSDIGSKIHRKRSAFIEALSPIVREFYLAISGGREEITINYRSKLNEGAMEALLLQSVERDKVLGYTSVGIHRDDITLLMDGHAIRSVGSQGQQKSLLLAIKLAEAKLIAQYSEKRAILLLDDVFDKLDMQRVENLVELVAGENFGQIFISDANKVRLEGIVERFDKNYKMYEVNSGKITQLK